MVGLVVLFSQWGRVDGMILGGLGIAVGLFSQYLIFSRLDSPMKAVRFALRPRSITYELAVDVLSRSHDNVSDYAHEFINAVQTQYPDVQVVLSALAEPEHRAVSVSGDLYYIIAASQAELSLETANRILEELEEPLKKHHYSFVWLAERSITGTEHFSSS